MSEVARKAENAGGNSEAINVRQLQTSQYDHSTGTYVKNPLRCGGIPSAMAAGASIAIRWK